VKVFPSSHEKLITFSLLAFTVGILAGLLFNVGSEHPDVFVIAFATVAAAFSGAWYAFRLQNRHDKQEQIRRNTEAANRAMFSVYSLWNIQTSYQRDVLAKYGGDDYAWLLLKATPATNFPHTSFPVEHLDFLLSSKHSQVYSDLIQEERRYEIFRQLVEYRNELVLNKLRPTMEKLEIKQLKHDDIPNIERELGPDVTGGLRDTTNSIIKFNRENVISLRLIYKKLWKALKSIYPDQEFVIVNFDD
jgi:uncharacterized protein YprB with RNaseH-like and TPR domain